MAESTGLMDSLKQLVGTLLAIFHTRLELLSNEMEEERLRIEQIMLYGGIVLFLFGLAIMMLTVFVVVLFWDSYRLEVLGGLAGLFVVAGLLASIALRRAARQRSKMFSTSLYTLAEDRDRLNTRR